MSKPDDSDRHCDDRDRSAPWYQSAFEAQYLTLYRHRTDEAARKEVLWAANAIRHQLSRTPSEQPPSTPRLLDLACGNGRHARALSAAGFDVVALDYSQDLLAHASTREDAPPVHYLRGDMRHLPLRGSFDAVSSFFTSFGYFQNEAEDRRVLSEVARVLRPHGVFLQDFLNAARVRETLVPESVEERDGWRLDLRRRITDGGKRVEKQVLMTAPDGAVRRYTESVRLYELVDFERMLPQAGLELLQIHGDLDGGPFQPDSSRLVCLSRRRPESAE